jgi:hypothetical protein
MARLDVNVRQAVFSPKLQASRMSIFNALVEISQVFDVSSQKARL